MCRLHLARMIKKNFGKKHRLNLLNNLRCEAHRVLYITAVKREIYNIMTDGGDHEK